MRQHFGRVRKSISSELNLWLSVCIAFGFCALAGCRQKMADQPEIRAPRPQHLFEDGRAARPLVEGTVARGELRGDELLYTGKEGGKPVDLFPFPATLAVLTPGPAALRHFLFALP